MVYTESQSLQGPAGFVSAVCCMPPSDQFPRGLVFVGSHDCNIYCFNLEGNSPLHKLLGHSGAVCSLATGQFGTLVSGSWDKTARVWSGQKCMLTLEGHQGAVWAVALMPQQGLILTEPEIVRKHSQVMKTVSVDWLSFRRKSFCLVQMTKPFATGRPLAIVCMFTR
ncbi:phospholipase A-2-activating protein-like [Tropilaelaps mercedesae]|uniref:Phospholipase A-2-activating protein-like n=1 Tax=Tropilaelaps mercedesae TaxID=418985 RepID=A0A1V9XFI6_9ACAR|nr:phospholipase A-2-activating protein-like [Tropilaelaps mercedesae]